LGEFYSTSATTLNIFSGIMATFSSSEHSTFNVENRDPSYLTSDPKASKLSRINNCAIALDKEVPKVTYPHPRDLPLAALQLCHSPPTLYSGSQHSLGWAVLLPKEALVCRLKQPSQTRRCNDGAYRLFPSFLLSYSDNGLLIIRIPVVEFHPSQHMNLITDITPKSQLPSESYLKTLSLTLLQL